MSATVFFPRNSGLAYEKIDVEIVSYVCGVLMGQHRLL